MGTSNGVAAKVVSADDFKAGFSSTRTLIHREWPSVEEAALDATGGDLDRLTDLIAGSTPARVTVRRHLIDLHHASTDVPPTETARVAARIDDTLARLEARMRELSAKLSDGFVPALEAKAKANLWQTLLMALGLGMVLGLFLRFGSRRVR